MQKSKLGVRHEYKLEKIKELLKIMSEYKDICFRGGTALSLCYNTIQRFSEDIDISIFGKKSNVPHIVKAIKADIKKLKWVQKLEDDSKTEIKIFFENNKPKPVYSNDFDDTKIIIEYPKEKRTWKKTELSHAIIQPFKDADFKMPVMSINSIFTDKAWIIFKNFSKKSNFDWAIKNRASARHLYDVQILAEKKCNLNNDHLIHNIHNEFIKQDGSSRGNNENIKNNQIHFLKTSNEWNTKIFKEELKKINKEISDKLSKLIYPNAEKFKIRLFLSLYERYFKYILKTVKKEYKFRNTNILNKKTIIS